MALKYNNCRCIGCNTNLFQKLLLQISFNWKTIQCDTCKREHSIVLPQYSYNSFFYGFPIGVLAGYLWYIDVFGLIGKVVMLLIAFILFLFIYTLLLIKKTELH